MAGPKPYAVRPPAVAGMFYPADPAHCRAQAAAFLAGKAPGAARGFGAVTPHAGWICSGAVAGEAIHALRRIAPEVDLVVVFAAVHTPIPLDRAALDDFSAWQSPIGSTDVVEDLRNRLGENRDWFIEDDRFHTRDHAVEVELPMIQLAWPTAGILPVETPLIDDAAEIGRITARRIQAEKVRAVYLASSDLTHYGPAYDYAPAGAGEDAVRWARRNDARLIDRVLEMDIDGIVDEVRHHRNACGGGAIAAMLAACREAGASQGELLTHTSSFEVLSRVAPQSADNTVGYASIVIS